MLQGTVPAPLSSNASVLAPPWRCNKCTYEHLGEEAEFLVCAVCGETKGRQAEAMPQEPDANIPDACAVDGSDMDDGSKPVSRSPWSRRKGALSVRQAQIDAWPLAAPSPAQRLDCIEEGCANAGVIVRSRGMVDISLPGRNMTDEDVARWCHSARPQLASLASDAPSLCADTVDLAGNRISSTGLVALVDILLDLRLYVRVFKLHKNVLGSKAVSALARYVACCPRPVEELHLSHNVIDTAGAAALVEAIVSAGSPLQPTYPSRDERGRFRPVWLRLEHNRVRAPGELLDSGGPVQQALARIRRDRGFACQPDVPALCGAPDGCGCRSRNCGFQRDALGPVVHLPFLTRACSAPAASNRPDVSQVPGAARVSTPLRADAVPFVPAEAVANPLVPEAPPHVALPRPLVPWDSLPGAPSPTDVPAPRFSACEAVVVATAVAQTSQPLLFV